MILRSEDGGATWAQVPAGYDTPTLRAAHFTRDGRLAVVVGDGGVILRSTDGAKTFTRVATGYDTPMWRGVRFALDGKLGFVVGAGGEVSVSRDGGATWTGLEKAPNGLHGVSVSADGGRVVAVGEAGLVWRSTDQGATWSKIDSGTTMALNAIGFELENNNEGWAVGDKGTILVTVDGALQFAASQSPVAADFNAVEDF